MDEQGRKIRKEIAEHSGEAMRLLKKSKQLRQAEKDGLIPKGTSLEAVIKLNKKAAEEIQKVIELRKKYLYAHARG